jgi:hypothetical protein
MPIPKVQHHEKQKCKEKPQENHFLQVLDEQRAIE